MDRLEVRMTLPSYVRFATTHRVGSEGQDDLSHADSRGSFAGRGDLREHGAKIMVCQLVAKLGTSTRAECCGCSALGDAAPAIIGSW